MKVLFVMTDIYYSGAEYQVRNIIDCCLEANDMEVYIASENRTLDESDKESREYLEGRGLGDGVVFNMNIGKNTSVIISVILLVKRLVPYLKQNKFDIVFIYDQYGLIAIPIINMFVRDIVYSERNAGDTTVRRFIYRHALKKCSLITCNSAVAKKTIEEALPVHVERINNIVTVADNITARHPGMQTITVVVPARVARIKNQIVVLKALMQPNNDRHFKIIIAGKAEEADYESMLRRYAESHKGCMCEVEFKGYISNKEELYNEADLVILPSYSEGTPNVVLESFARKIPVIASKIPQCEELYKDDGFLFDPDKPDDLRQKINYFLSMPPEDIDRFLMTNYLYVEENYSKERGPQRYVDFFRALDKGKDVAKEAGYEG